MNQSSGQIFEFESRACDILKIVCLENGLSVIEPRKPGQREKRTVYPNRKSIRDSIREKINLVMEKQPKDMDDFLKLLEKEGFTIKRGKHLALKGADQKSFLRIDSLGVGYREADLEKVFAGEEAFDSHVRKEQNQKTRRKEI